MRFKWVPEPPDSLSAVTEAQRAIPLVPAAESTCLRRLVDRTDETGIDDQDDASEWVTFLRALRLVEQTPSGYRRARVELTADELLDRLLDGVYGASELYDALRSTGAPRSLDELDGTVALPTWERHHHGSDHERVRRERQQRLVEWFVLCGVAERTADGYTIHN